MPVLLSCYFQKSKKFLPLIRNELTIFTPKKIRTIRAHRAHIRRAKTPPARPPRGRLKSEYRTPWHGQRPPHRIFNTFSPFFVLFMVKINVEFTSLRQIDAKKQKKPCKSVLICVENRVFKPKTKFSPETPMSFPCRYHVVSMSFLCHLMSFACRFVSFACHLRSFEVAPKSPSRPTLCLLTLNKQTQFRP